MQNYIIIQWIFEIQQAHDHCRQMLQAIEMRVVAGRKVRSCIRWKYKGDMESVEFFQSILEKPASTMITCLRDGNGTKIRHKRELGTLCSQFYCYLYKVQAMITDCIAAMDATPETLESRLPFDAYQQLDNPIMIQQLGNAAKDLARGQSPRFHGHTIEFYVKP